jgi:hypothetical protein
MKIKDMDYLSLKRELRSLENIYFTETSRRTRLLSQEQFTVYDSIYNDILSIKEEILFRDTKNFQLKYNQHP